MSKDTSNMPSLADMLRDRLKQGDAQGWDNPDDEQGCLACLIAELTDGDTKHGDLKPELRRLRARLAAIESTGSRR